MRRFNLPRWARYTIYTLGVLIAGCAAAHFAQTESKLPAFDVKRVERSSVPAWSTWTRYTTPVFPGQYPATGDPSVIRDGDHLLMAYSCFDPRRKRPETCLATSKDGFAWQFVAQGDDALKGQALRAGSSRWADTHETPFLMKWKGRYWLYVSGYNDRGGGSMNSFPAYLGLAESDDARQFRFVSPEPIMKGTPGWYDSDAIFSASVVEDKGTLYMVYAGHCWHNCKVKPGVYLLGATSTDGRTWRKHDRQLFEGAKMPAFYKQYAGEPEIVKGPDGMFYLFFSALQGDDPHMIGLARGPTPFGPWEFRPEPIVRASADGPNDAETVAPSVLIEDGRARMWFSGFSKRRMKAIAIYYAEAPWPLKQ